jgi:hypothetical protein
MSNNRPLMIAAAIGAGVAYAACLTYRTLASYFNAAPKQITFRMSDVLQKKPARQTAHDCLLKYAARADGRRTIHTAISIARCINQYASLTSSERLMTNVVFHSGDHVVAELVSGTADIQRKIDAHIFHNPYGAVLQAALMDVDMGGLVSDVRLCFTLERGAFNDWRAIHETNVWQTARLSGEE